MEAQLPRRPFVFFLSLIIKSCTLFWLGGARKVLGVSMGAKREPLLGDEPTRCSVALERPAGRERPVGWQPS